MNAFATSESDLARRIRGRIGGGLRRMGTRRVLAAILLCPLAALTLPSCGAAGKRTGGDMEALAARETMAEAGQIDGIWREAMATDPDEWSGELKARLLELRPDSTIEEIAGAVRHRRLWQEAMATDPDEWSDELKARYLALNASSTIEEIAEAVRKRREDEAIAARRLKALAVVKRAMATPQEEWSEELKADIVRDGWELDEFTEGIRSRMVGQEAMATDPDEWSEELKAELLAFNPGSTIEEMAETVRKRQEGADPDLEEAVARGIRAEVERGELTAEEGREQMEAFRRRLEKGAFTERVKEKRQ